MLSRVWRALTGSRVGRVVRAAYDAAKNTLEMRKHWAEADGLDAVNAMNPEVRLRLRARSRYEGANNPIVSGIFDTLASDVIALGPGLSIDIEDYDTADAIEDRFHEHAEAINLWEKLRCAERAQAESGECFVKFFFNPELPTPVKLDVELIEADRVETPLDLINDPMVIDGIRFDARGNRVGYYVAKFHPGAPLTMGMGFKAEFEFVPAKYMRHHFKLIRPGQVRGIPELTPSLTACALLRRWCLAVVKAAERIASLGAAVIETQAPPNTEEVETGTPGTALEYQQGGMTFVPVGTSVKQLKAEQPTATHDSYFRNGVREIVRPVSMPLNVALCDSSGYNYASGRLDHQTYDRTLAIRQDRIACGVITPFMLMWFGEAVLITGFLPQAARTLDMATPPHTWDWQEREHVDPAKSSTANTNDVNNLLRSRREIYGRRSKDWRRELRQIARELKEIKALGLTIAITAPVPVTPDGKEEREDEDEREEKEDGDA